MRSQSGTYAVHAATVKTKPLNPGEFSGLTNGVCEPGGNRAQKSTRRETWPVRLPPKSDPRAELITPKFPLAIFRVGSARFV